MIKEFVKAGFRLIKSLATDPDIPARDKGMAVLGLLLLVSPIDLIPWFVPVLGQLDDLAIFIILVEYFFHRLPETVILRHYPWDPASYRRWKSRTRILSWIVPDWVREKIWAKIPENQPDPMPEAG